LLFVSLIENVRETEQKKQPSNIKLHEEVTVTIKQLNQEVMSEKEGTRSFTLT